MLSKRKGSSDSCGVGFRWNAHGVEGFLKRGGMKGQDLLVDEGSSGNGIVWVPCIINGL